MHEIATEGHGGGGERHGMRAGGGRSMREMERGMRESVRVICEVLRRREGGVEGHVKEVWRGTGRRCGWARDGGVEGHGMEVWRGT